MTNILIDGHTRVCYDTVDGHVKEVAFNGDILYSECEGIEVAGWKEVLDRVGDGLFSFMFWMEEHGYL